MNDVAAWVGWIVMAGSTVFCLALLASVARLWLLEKKKVGDSAREHFRAFDELRRAAMAVCEKHEGDESDEMIELDNALERASDSVGARRI